MRRTSAKGSSPYEVYRAGELHGRITRRIGELAEIIGTVDSIWATTNLRGERWWKLCVNGMANGVAATGLLGNDMNGNEKIQRLSLRLGGERVRVGQRSANPSRTTRSSSWSAPSSAGTKRNCTASASSSC